MNPTTFLLRPATPICHLFSRQAQEKTEAIALTHDNQQYSFGEINRQANRLARNLRRLGVGPEVRVALCVEDGIWWVVGSLGILKARGAFVSLDPAWPSDRSEWILNEANVNVLVSRRCWLPALPATSTKLLFFDIEDLESDDNDETGEEQDSTIGASLAYIVYTSGSMGRPKGVMVTNDNLNCMSAARTRYYGSCSETLWLAVSMVFDAGIGWMLWALSSGRKVVLPSVSTHDGDIFGSITEMRATHLAIAASMYRLILDRVEHSSLSTVRRVTIGGESCPLSLVDAHLKIAPEVVMTNEYGPTEATIWSTVHQCSPADLQRARVSIGKPVDGVRVYILDQFGMILPVGAVGELYISGDGVARGYLQQPGLTASCFIPDFHGEPGSRMYKTGDRARLRGDGSLEFLGRFDEQLKIRGYRIEPGEIENVLNEHPAVKGSVVIGWKQGESDDRLVAYVTAEKSAAIQRELRNYLRDRLPEYMMPATVMVIDELPLMANGKVDRKALPEPIEQAAMPIEDSPQTVIEQIVSEVLAGVLQRERVGLDEDFFAMGGHSLLAIQVISRMGRTFSIELSLEAFFQAPTVRELATRIDDLRMQGGGREAPPPIVVVGRDNDLPLSFAQHRLWFLHYLDPASAAYNMPSGIRLRGNLNIEILRLALSEIVRRHEILRTTFPASVSGDPIQRIAPALPVQLPVIDFSASVLSARTYASQEGQLPFDLSNGPLFRAQLLRLGVDDHALLITMHHIITDGWSTGIFGSELKALYEALQQGLSSPLPELPVQYADFAYWQRTWLQAQVLEDQLRYWRKKLVGVPKLALPFDHQRTAAQRFTVASIDFKLRDGIGTNLREIARSEGVTVYMILLAAFKAFLYSCTGQIDIAIGSPFSNRAEPVQERLIGLFLNTLVLRTQLSGELTFRELLAHVRDTVLNASAHQYLPFEKLVDELRPQREVNENPLFNVWFLVQTIPATAIAPQDGLQWESVGRPVNIAKADLSLALTETERGFAGVLSYCENLFKPETRAALADHLKVVIEAAIGNPDSKLLELPLAALPKTVYDTAVSDPSSCAVQFQF